MKITKFKTYLKMAQSTVYSEPDTPHFHTPVIIKAINDLIPLMTLTKDGLILDIGCGQGAFMTEMTARGEYNLVGVTLSPEDAIDCLAKGFQVLNCDFSDIAYKDKAAQMIWCRHALEHSPYPLFTLFEFNRLLQDDGWLYVEVPAPNLDRFHENNPNHYSVLGDRMWANLFRTAGFEIATYQHIGFDITVDDKKMNELFYCFVLKKNKSLPCTQ